MTGLTLIALAAGGLALLYTIIISVRGSAQGNWLLAATVSAAFLVYSVWPMTSIAPFGFWTEHVRNAWGIQIWFDLLCAISVAWFFIVPRAKLVGMRPLPWLIPVFALGSIGLLAAVARLFWLERNRANGA